MNPAQQTTGVTQAGFSFGLASRLKAFIEGAGISCEIRLQNGELIRFGSEEPRFRVTVSDNKVLVGILDELSAAEAYIQGKLDIEGDMIALIELGQKLKDNTLFADALKFWYTLLFGNTIQANRTAIKSHYGFGNDFYLSFLDSKYRLYSQALFESAEESLETASERKLETCFRELNLSPGMRVLDIGGGWGSATEYFGSRGVNLTTLTIGDDSYQYITDLIQRKQLPCRVLLQDFLDHRPEAPYDAVMTFGAIEHVPNYRKFAEQVWRCLKPSGLIYIDGSASVEKYDMGSFARRYVWPGTHTFMSLSELTQELLYNGFQVLTVRNESREYELTALHWAKRLEAHKNPIVQGWGDPLYRTFRLYLWGTVHAFQTDLLQAYHLVARRKTDAGSRPGRLRRTRSFFRDLV